MGNCLEIDIKWVIKKKARTISALASFFYYSDYSMSQIAIQVILNSIKIIKVLEVRYHERRTKKILKGDIPCNS